MISNLEEWIGKKLLGPYVVGQEPLAACEECRLHPLIPQIVDDPAVIAAHLVRLLAEIEGQRDYLLIRGEPHASYDAAQPRIDGLERSKRTAGRPAKRFRRPLHGLPIVRRPAQLGGGPAHRITGTSQRAAMGGKQE